jgi:hypothetical protein
MLTISTTRLKTDHSFDDIAPVVSEEYSPWTDRRIDRQTKSKEIPIN